MLARLNLRNAHDMIDDLREALATARAENDELRAAVALLRADALKQGGTSWSAGRVAKVTSRWER